MQLSEESGKVIWYFQVLPSELVKCLTVRLPVHLVYMPSTQATKRWNWPSCRMTHGAHQEHLCSIGSPSPSSPVQMPSYFQLTPSFDAAMPIAEP